jgi:AraC-like DNA-binding protein
LLLGVLVFIIGYEFWHGRSVCDDAFQLRRRSFLCFFLVLFAATLSDLTIVEDGRVEMFPTLTISLHYSAFVTFVLLASAYFGRRNYRNPYIWFFLLQYPAVLILLNILMRVMGHYHPLFSAEDTVMPNNPVSRMIFLVRIAWLGLIFLVYFFMLAVLLGAYINARRHRKERESDMESRQILHEQSNILLYVILLVFTMVSHMFTSLLLHIACHLLLVVLLLWSLKVYIRFTTFTKMKLQGSFSSAIIEDGLKRLNEQERANPIYASNSSLDDVAAALGVSREELSQYIYDDLGLSYSAWVSERKLCRCAQLLRTTDRMITDIAIATGYCNAPAMNKAFKARYGMTPSVYRSGHSLQG